MDDRVVVAGVGMHPFGRFDASPRVLGQHAAVVDLRDAGVTWRDVDAAYVASMYLPATSGARIKPPRRSAICADHKSGVQHPGSIRPTGVPMTARSARRRSGSLLMLALLAVLALIAAACGSDDDDGSDAGAAAPTTEAEGPAASGEPVKVLVIGPTNTQIANTPDIPPAAEAAARAVNERGGIGTEGRPLEIVYCNDNFTPNGATACANQAAEEDMVALVGGFTAFGTLVFPALERDGIAAVGLWPSTPADFLSPNAFLLGAGTLGGYAGQAKAAKDAGMKSLATLQASDSSSTSGRVAAGAEFYGLEHVGTLDTPPTITDYAPVIADLQRRGAEAVSLAVGSTQTVQIVQAASQLGYEPLWLNADGNMTIENLETLGPLAEGMTFVGSLPAVSEDAENEDIRRMFTEYGAVSGAPPLVATGANTWLAVQAFERITRNLDVIDSASVLAAMNEATEVDLFGIIPPWNPGKPGPVAAFPRLANPFLYVSRWTGDRFEQVTQEPFDAAPILKTIEE